MGKKKYNQITRNNTMVRNCLRTGTKHKIAGGTYIGALPQYGQVPGPGGTFQWVKVKKGIPFVRIE